MDSLTWQKILAIIFVFGGVALVNLPRLNLDKIGIICSDGYKNSLVP